MDHSVYRCDKSVNRWFIPDWWIFAASVIPGFMDLSHRSILDSWNLLLCFIPGLMDFLFRRQKQKHSVWLCHRMQISFIFEIRPKIAIPNNVNVAKVNGFRSLPETCLHALSRCHGRRYDRRKMRLDNPDNSRNRARSRRALRTVPHVTSGRWRCTSDWLWRLRNTDRSIARFCM